MADNDKRNVREAIGAAASVEREAIVAGAMASLTEDAARSRGFRTGANLAASATEKAIAISLGYGSAQDLRNARRAAPEDVLASLIG